MVASKKPLTKDYCHSPSSNYRLDLSRYTYDMAEVALRRRCSIHAVLPVQSVGGPIRVGS